MFNSSQLSAIWCWYNFQFDECTSCNIVVSSKSVCRVLTDENQLQQLVYVLVLCFLLIQKIHDMCHLVRREAFLVLTAAEY